MVISLNKFPVKSEKLKFLRKTNLVEQTGNSFQKVQKLKSTCELSDIK